MAIAIARALQQARSVSDSEHYDHHIWITEKIKRERMEMERHRSAALFWQRMHGHAVSWGMASVLTAALYAAWLLLRENSR